jgi:GNAT superfamily N-acetyltransferase
LLVGGVNAEWLDSLRHDLSGFSCGDPSVDGWLPTSIESEVAGARTRVAVFGQRVLGCYRLGAFQVGAQSGHPWGAEGEPVRAVLGVLISRLGVDVGWQGRGLGSALLVDAVVLAERVSAATHVQLVVVKADAERGDGCCARFGFRPPGSVVRWRYLPVRDVQATLRRASG